MHNQSYFSKSQRILRHFVFLFILFVLTALLAACSISPSDSENSITQLPPTLTLPPAHTEIIPADATETPLADATDTPSPLCTPPPCNENESYYCPDECPGGCGTGCATHTPGTSELLPTTTDKAPVNMQSFPNPGDYHWKAVTSGLASPVGITHAGDGSNRLFILEQGGVIRILADGQLLTAPFLDIRSRVGTSGNEQGLLGLAFHPEYAENGLFFVDYTDLDGNTVISRFQVSTDRNIAEAGSETILLQVKQPYQNHNGGHIIFGPDGYLYIGLGDGGSAGDPQGNGQNLSTLLGNILRLDINQGSPYAIPADNPYANGGGQPEIWASGLRNPWRYSFDRATGDLYIGDVGQNQWEEIHFLSAEAAGGANFGWNYWEGLHPFQGSPPEDIEFEFPIWEYGHDQGCSVTGGFVYRGSMSAWQGIYLYGDFCSGQVWGLLRDSNNIWQNTLLFETAFNITSFGEDESGEIYLVDRTGSIYQLTKR